MAKGEKETLALGSKEQQLIAEKFREYGNADDITTAANLGAEIAQAITLPLRKVLLSGDILGGIFEPLDYTNNPRVEFPLDLLTPGQEKEFYAYTMPGEGKIPERRVEADYLMVPTYIVGNGIDCSLRFIRDANWPVIQRMIEVLEAGFVKKMNDDGWQTIITAGLDRNIIVNNPNASNGQFTPRLVTLLSTFMRRNGGGNTATLGRSKLTDLYTSPESLMDMRAWTLDLVPDMYRVAVFNQADTNPDEMNLWGVNIHALDELGEGQEYQNYFANTLGGTMPAGNVEIGIGLDRQRNDSFVMPVRKALQVYEDNTVFRRGVFSLFGNVEYGLAALDSRRCIIASL